MTPYARYFPVWVERRHDRATWDSSVGLFGDPGAFDEVFQVIHEELDEAMDRIAEMDGHGLVI